jgi:hypothetical protein
MTKTEKVVLATLPAKQSVRQLSAYGRQANTRAWVIGKNITASSDDLFYGRYESPTDLPDLGVAYPQWHLALSPVPGWGWWQREVTIDHADMIMVVLGMRFADKDSRERFVAATKAHGDYCLRNEPATLVYGLGQIADRSPSADAFTVGDLVVIMACADQHALDQHANDPKHLALASRMADLRIEVESHFSQTYQLRADGFLWR